MVPLLAGTMHGRPFASQKPGETQQMFYGIIK